ncbi:MAG: hypothetical protein MUE44_09545 [Oscillatoriaceae cyanobacterium Prado104]|jgi:hypothetical protein|nr:hypothetical protein [Oscillatoriaceae cyanobacterium Prado104]
MRNQEMLTDGEESVQLIDEIGELKEILREVSKKLTRIETRVKREAIAAASKSVESPSAVSAKKAVDLSAEEVLQIYEDLRLKAKSGDEEYVRKKLLSMSATDLNLMCCELGMPPSSKNPSRRKMFELIIGRIKQSLMLSRHIDRQTI